MSSRQTCRIGLLLWMVHNLPNWNVKLTQFGMTSLYRIYWRTHGRKSSVFLIKRNSIVIFITLRFTQKDRNQKAENSNPGVWVHVTYFNSREWHCFHTVVLNKKKNISSAAHCPIHIPSWQFSILYPNFIAFPKSRLTSIGSGHLYFMICVLNWQLSRRTIHGQVFWSLQYSIS